VFALIPALCLGILAFKQYKFLFIFLIILFSALHIPAHYGDESYLLTRTTELRGSEFFTEYSGDNKPYFYQFYPYIHYFSPGLVSTAYYTFSAYQYPDIQILDNIDIVIDSIQTRNRLIYLFGQDYIKNWISTNRVHSSLYDNGYFTLYSKRG
jgi:hypothetical protein